MEAGILRYGRIAAETAEVEHLVLSGEPAALRIVIAGDALLKNALVVNIPVEIMDDAEAVLLESYRGVRVEKMRESRDVLARGCSA